MWQWRLSFQRSYNSSQVQLNLIISTSTDVITMSSYYVITPPSLTFTQGFILGQLSFLAIVLLFVRYVVFSPSSPQDTESWQQRRKERHKVRHSHPF